MRVSNEYAIALDDADPSSRGHTLVAPRKHVGSLSELNTNEQNAVLRLIREVKDQLRIQFTPDGFNVGWNEGAAAGQTNAHATVDIIPRYKGDMRDPRGGIRRIIRRKPVGSKVRAGPPATE